MNRRFVFILYFNTVEEVDIFGSVKRTVADASRFTRR